MATEGKGGLAPLLPGFLAVQLQPWSLVLGDLHLLSSWSSP